MDGPPQTGSPSGLPQHSRRAVVTARGISQTLAWASGYYLPAILADPIGASLHVPRTWIFAAFSMALLIAAFAGPKVARVAEFAALRRPSSG